ncbi:MAG: deoxyribodipyrimidine photo-lyase [Gammaproteobacteria bacterium]|nr:deoxyribodipyrimidine photo-lyase [Gammaproteobacteria bacterium]
MSSTVQTNVVVQEKVLPVEVIVWLVRDTLRLYDNPALVLACNQAMQRGAALIPLVCLEPRRWADQQFGLPRIGLMLKGMKKKRSPCEPIPDV